MQTGSQTTASATNQSAFSAAPSYFLKFAGFSAA